MVGKRRNSPPFIGERNGFQSAIRWRMVGKLHSFGTWGLRSAVSIRYTLANGWKVILKQLFHEKSVVFQSAIRWRMVGKGIAVGRFQLGISVSIRYTLANGWKVAVQKVVPSDLVMFQSAIRWRMVGKLVHRHQRCQSSGRFNPLYAGEWLESGMEVTSVVDTTQFQSAIRWRMVGKSRYFRSGSPRLRFQSAIRWRMVGKKWGGSRFRCSGSGFNPLYAGEWLESRKDAQR